MKASTLDTDLLRRLPGLETQVPLHRFSTFRVGGPARYFLRATTTDQLVRAVATARELELPFFVLGNGSNTLIADRGFPGLVVQAVTDGLTFHGRWLLAEAGIKLSVLLALAGHRGLAGLECLAGVPGTVGGAVYGNAGSRIAAIGDVVTQVRCLTRDGRERVYNRPACRFAYRSSRFKTSGEIILAARLTLEPGDPAAIERRLAELVREKNVKQPTSQQSAGCIFQNVPVSEATVVPPALRPFIVDGQLSSWRLIAAAGLQGRRLGGVSVSTRHANFIVNVGGGTARQIVTLVRLIKQRVRDRFGIQLVEEVQSLGFANDEGQARR